MSETILASGPDRYFGGTMETWALPMGAFIVIALVLYWIYKRPHNVPKLKYLEPAHQTSFGTREPGTAGLTVLHGPVPASAPVAEATTAVPGAQAPHGMEAVPHPEVVAERQAAGDEPAGPGAAARAEGDT